MEDHFVFSMAKTGGVEKRKTKSGTSSRAWIKCGQIPKVNGPSRRNPEDAAADLIKLLAVSREDLHRLASDLKDAAKKKTCVEKHGQGWRSVVRVGKKIVRGPVRATQDVAERDVISSQGERCMSSFFDAVAEIPKANYEDNTQFTHPDLEPYPVYLPHSSEGLPYTTASSDLIPQLASLLTSATQISAKLRQQKTLAAEASAQMNREEEEEERGRGKAEHRKPLEPEQMQQDCNGNLQGAWHQSGKM